MTGDGTILICHVSEDAYIADLVAQAAEDDHWDSLEALAQDAQLDREYCQMVYGEPEEEEHDGHPDAE